MRPRSRNNRLALLVLVVFLGCAGKTINNLGGIRGTTDIRADGVIVNISLRTDTGERLVWDTNLVTPAGGGVLDPRELDTRIQVFSTLNGQRNEQIFAGRLKSLNWNFQGDTRFGGPTFRSLIGLVPHNLLALDAAADSALGELEVTLITPRQGEFHTTVYDAQVYPAAFF
ncbi:hypothetical protein HN371_18655 [Candidatus Poribacteria bacterium]|jgi:hypothetical protein|nr:hypothetical protein [Candidatus Poribacteria bacterium]MBT5711426.1 hypothetical protein [Candidatus Poribacteria bacterium]MBT7804409.1 hypothetical protein [Candidatus Poribacteria bacterium]